jgi:hypothetical protein
MKMPSIVTLLEDEYESIVNHFCIPIRMAGM